MADLTTSKQRAVKRSPGPGKPFAKGISGNPAGRPVGARNRLAGAFLEAAEDSFTKHGPKAFEELRFNDLPTWVKVMASLLPKEMDLAGEGGGPIKLVISWERS